MQSITAAVVHQELRDRCAPFHTALEDLLDLQSTNISRTRYLDILVAFHSYYAPLDAKLKKIGVPRFDASRKLAWLSQDLTYFDQEPRVASAPVPELETDADAYGALYVIEGAALGGQYIARSLEDQLGLKDEGGNHFFSSNGANVALHWKEFRGALTNFVGDDRDRLERVVQSAMRVFATLHQHFEQQLTTEARQ